MSIENKSIVSYERVSTNEKGQDPERQEKFNRAWAETYGLIVVSSIKDIGTSASKVSPFERPRFMEAIRKAHESSSIGIVVESVDRLTREGTDMWGWVRIELKQRYGLDVYQADAGPPNEQGFMVDEIIASIKAAQARHETEQRSRRTAEGMQRKIAVGAKMGAPVKDLRPEHIQEIIRLKHQHNWGYRRIAVRISKLRGAEDVADNKARRRRRVSHEKVRSVYLQAKANPSIMSNRQISTKRKEAINPSK